MGWKWVVRVLWGGSGGRGEIWSDLSPSHTTTEIHYLSVC